MSDRTLHVVPRGDIVEHDTATEEPTCVCGPRLEHVNYDEAPDGWILVHHSLDGREARDGEVAS